MNRSEAISALNVAARDFARAERVCSSTVITLESLTRPTQPDTLPADPGLDAVDLSEVVVHLKRNASILEDVIAVLDRAERAAR